MISNDLKKIIDLAGGRYIVVEAGKPRYVVMNFDEYKDALLNQKSVQLLTEEELVDKINSDISLWREKQKEESSVIAEIEKLEDIEYV